MLPESAAGRIVLVVCKTIFAPDDKDSPLTTSIEPALPAAAEPVRIDTSCTPVEESSIPPLLNELDMLAPALIVIAPPVSVSELPDPRIIAPALSVSEDPATREISPAIPATALPERNDISPLKPLLPDPVEISTLPELLPPLVTKLTLPLLPASLAPLLTRICPPVNNAEVPALIRTEPPLLSCESATLI